MTSEGRHRKAQKQLCIPFLECLCVVSLYVYRHYVFGYFVYGHYGTTSLVTAGNGDGAFGASV